MTDQWEKLRSHLLPLLVLLLVTLASYGRIIGHEFIFNWDDSFYVIDNEAIQGISLDHIRTVFSRFYVGNYSPVQMLSYMLDYTLGGLSPAGFLFSNLLLHCLNGLLVYRILFKLHQDQLAATVGAAIFLLHPVQVESVAWVSQRKNLLAMTFFLLAWVAYLRYREDLTSRGWYRYGTSLAMFVLSLLSKSMTVIFPLVLLLFDRCYPGPGGRSRYLDKIPYLLAAGCVALLSMVSQLPDDSVWGGGGGRLEGFHGGSALATFLTMLPVGCRYLGMLVLPVGLSAEYTPVIQQTLNPSVSAAAIALAVVGLLSLWLIWKHPTLGFWAVYFWIGLLPVSQVVPLVTLMNDRYLYLPLLGPAALAGVGVSALWLKSAGKRGLALRLVMIVVLVLLPVLTYQRAGVWATPVTLWRDTVAKNPERSAAWEKLGEALHAATPPQTADAIRAYRRALELAPRSEITLYNLGVLNSDVGNYPEAAELLRILVTNNPDHVMGWAALGSVYQNLGQLGDAEMAFHTALNLQPDALQVVRLLADLSFLGKQYEQARERYLTLEDRGWGDAETAYRLACVEAVNGDVHATSSWLSKALERGFSDQNKILSSRELAGVITDFRIQALLNRYLKVSVPKQ